MSWPARPPPKPAPKPRLSMLPRGRSAGSLTATTWPRYARAMGTGNEARPAGPRKFRPDAPSRDRLFADSLLLVVPLGAGMQRHGHALERRLELDALGRAVRGHHLAEVLEQRLGHRVDQI